MEVAGVQVNQPHPRGEAQCARWRMYSRTSPYSPVLPVLCLTLTRTLTLTRNYLHKNGSTLQAKYCIKVLYQRGEDGRKEPNHHGSHPFPFPRFPISHFPFPISYFLDFKLFHICQGSGQQISHVEISFSNCNRIDVEIIYSKCSRLGPTFPLPSFLLPFSFHTLSLPPSPFYLCFCFCFCFCQASFVAMLSPNGKRLKTASVSRWDGARPEEDGHMFEMVRAALVTCVAAQL